MAKKTSLFRHCLLTFFSIQIGLVSIQANSATDTLELPEASSASERSTRLWSHPLEETPSLKHSVTLITREEMEARGSQTLIDAMQDAPGSWTETRGRKVNQFASFRGQMYPYPDYSLDGSWQREFHEVPYFIDANEVERIEVVRSSGSILQSLQGTSGVIRFETRDPETKYASFGISGDELFKRKINMAISDTWGLQDSDNGWRVSGAMSSDPGMKDMNDKVSFYNLSGKLHWQASENHKF